MTETWSITTREVTMMKDWHGTGRWGDRNRIQRQVQREFKMELKGNGSQPSGKGPDEYFTGTVHIDRYSSRLIRRAFSAQVLHSSPALERHGTRIRSGRP